ncbi:hypothetical protein MPTK1_7g11580 [Marchantia polymorpha subsp. ruderalis]|uniref:Uncharacterized protein n=2 Tax=Marchantia polymorpha TaxID=3197 RepID=A0AAF6BYG8_MARPO|nr:hypothetical protein MARPO_0003s0170 [Marchantia polymorpha]BBN17052.1 hypothetical protein Mp_7g11580 [Marchantia polymorpha subsp. ruderalis]|eukprot:PTQ49287.1 hypothetical protein MARPO_0003s0170 [Marchantia polymorpha]
MAATGCRSTNRSEVAAMSCYDGRATTKVERSYYYLSRIDRVETKKKNWVLSGSMYGTSNCTRLAGSQRLEHVGRITS